jgi:hypothetical protein
MTASTQNLPSADHAPAKRGRRWPARLGVVAIALVALVVGIVAGAAGNSHSSQMNTDATTISADHSKIAQLQGTVRRLQSDNNNLTTQLAGETNTADHALSIATAKVKAANASEQAQLNSEAATLKSKQSQLNTELGNVQANTISASGVYVVGTNIKSGTWYTSGDGGQTDNACYYATLNSANTEDIGDNNNFDGSETMDLSGVYAFQISGPCSWSLVSG